MSGRLHATHGGRRDSWPVLYRTKVRWPAKETPVHLFLREVRVARAPRASSFASLARPLDLGPMVGNTFSPPTAARKIAFIRRKMRLLPRRRGRRTGLQAPAATSRRGLLRETCARTPRASAQRSR